MTNTAHELDQRRPCEWCGSTRSRKRYQGWSDGSGHFNQTANVECVDDYGCFARQSRPQVRSHGHDPRGACATFCTH